MLVIFLPLTVAALMIGCFTFWLQDERQSASLRTAEFESIGRGAMAIESSVQDVAVDLVYLSQQASLIDFLDSGSASAREEVASDFLAFSRVKRLYDQVRYIDQTGREVVRVNYELGRPRVVAATQLQDKNNDYYVIDARNLKKCEVYVSPLDLNIEGGVVEEPLNPVIRLATAVFDRSGNRRGLVILNYFGQDMLGEFNRAAYTIADHAMLVNPGGYWLQHPDSSLRWGFMYGREDTLGRYFPRVWETLQGRDSGQEYIDGGLWTWQTVYPLVEGQKTSFGRAELSGGPAPGEKLYYWKVISFLPQEMISQQRQPRLAGYLGLTAGFVVFLLLGCILLARSRHARALLQVDLARHVTELEKALAEVRTLRGILPICMYCHKIRTDQASWQRLEQYLGQHTDAELSHGICPECERKYFPEDV
jgi:hypothetical protein